jgi:hypothetical protein
LVAATIEKLQNLNIGVKCMCFTPIEPMFQNYIGAANRMQHVAYSTGHCQFIRPKKAEMDMYFFRPRPKFNK